MNSDVYNDDYKLNLTVKYIAPILVKRINEFLRLKKSESLSLADVGCGNGSVLRHLRDLYGSRFSFTGLDQFPNQAEGIQFQKLDLNADFAGTSGQYDVLLCCEVIEHVVDTDHFISNLKNMLKPGGRLLLTTPNLSSFLNRILLLLGFQPLHTEVSWKNPYIGREVLYRIAGIEKSPAAGHLRLFTHYALQEFLKYHGFRIISCDGFTPYEGVMKYVSNLFFWRKSLMPGVVFCVEKLS